MDHATMQPMPGYVKAAQQVRRYVCNSRQIGCQHCPMALTHINCRGIGCWGGERREIKERGEAVRAG